VFTDEQELLLCERIQTEFLDNQLLFTDHDFRNLAIAAYYNWNPIDAASEQLTAKDFHGSNGFIHNFKQRHSFSSRRSHYKRRPAQTSPATLEKTRRWILSIRSLVQYRQEELSYVVNCDETCWRLYPNGILTWAKKGADGVSLDIRGNEKASITALATITAENTKLPLFIIAKGKTKRAEATQLGNIKEHRGDHSVNGWTTAETMSRYLWWLRELYPPVRTPFGKKALPIDLILDCYPAHLTMAVRREAAKLKIQLHFVPIGMTDKLQPLDRRVFGCLTATARAEYRRFSAAHPGEKVRTPDAVRMLIHSWEHLSLAAVEAAWSVYDDRERHRPDGEDDEWDPDHFSQDDESDDD
jgi:hypothetical protein